MTDRLTITEPRAAAAFSNSRSRALLSALMTSEHSLQGLRGIAGMSLTLLHYHVTKLCKLGLVRLVRSEARNGRARKIYAASALSYLVPAEVEGQGPRAGLRAELDASLERAGARSRAIGTVYYLDPAGTLKMERLHEGGDKPVSNEWWWRLELSDTDAMALSEEVRALVARYRGKAGEGRSFLCNFALGVRTRPGRNHFFDVYDQARP